MRERGLVIPFSLFFLLGFLVFLRKGKVIGHTQPLGCLRSGSRGETAGSDVEGMEQTGQLRRGDPSPGPLGLSERPRVQLRQEGQSWENAHAGCD